MNYYASFFREETNFIMDHIVNDSAILTFNYIHNIIKIVEIQLSDITD